MSERKFTKTSESFFVDPDYKAGLDELGLTSIDAVFCFAAATNLTKDNLAGFRSRGQFDIKSPPATLFLKRYDRPPVLVQLRNWLAIGRHASMSSLDFGPAEELAEAGINTPKTISFGWQWDGLFEKRSFCITEKIPNAESLERKLPHCFTGPATAEKLKLRRDFIVRLAEFVKKFHQTNYRHRDLYFSHIFYDNNGRFYLIDLARCFKPRWFAERFRIKDIAQIFYSAPAAHFSRTDRLRFYFALTGRRKLAAGDKVFIRKIKNKAKRMARHDIKHGRIVPFAG